MRQRKIRRTHKRIEFSFVFASLIALFLCIYLSNGIPTFEHTGDNTFHIYLNGQPVGTIDDGSRAEHLLIESRRKVASRTSSLMFMTGELEVKSEELLFGRIDSDSQVMEKMQSILSHTVDDNIQRTCTVKIEEYMVTLRNLEDARKLLQAALDLYDDSGRFVVELSDSGDRDFSVRAGNKRSF